MSLIKSAYELREGQLVGDWDPKQPPIVLAIVPFGYNLVKS